MVLAATAATAAPLAGDAGSAEPRTLPWWLDLLVLLLGIVVLTVGIRVLVAQAFYIPSRSMVPELEVDDRIVVSRISYRIHAPRRGDVVVFDEPAKVRALRPEEPGPSNPVVAGVRSLLQALNVVQPSTDEWVKRVVALPGETVVGRNGRVYVDDHLLVEPYLAPGVATTSFEPVKVPEGSLFVLGDNRSDSWDSRVFGPIPRSTVVGRAVVRVWPVSRSAFL